PTAAQAEGHQREAAELVGAVHPVQRLLDSPNPFWTRGDLWRATETYLGLWGSAYWGLERDAVGRVAEIWPLRPDRMRVVPDSERYIKGFVYVGMGQQLIPYVPEDVLWMRYFNPLEEHAGLSPIAPLRLSADMGLDALRANRNSLTNESTPGLFIETGETPTDDEVKEFYDRWELRFRGVDKARRPVLLSGGMKASNMGFSPRDMEYVQSLRWSLEDVARVYGVPKPMMGDLERITFSNFQTARKVFWEDTIVPQLTFYQDALQQGLLPNLGLDTAGLFVEFDLGAVEALQESENDRANRLQGYVKAGVMTINEVRRELNLPPVEWGDRPAPP
ncbi:MAG: phage portal protein, partial [Chloroflexi bacterium]|nr:phage portal protein [Chloroflexota bacterium]